MIEINFYKGKREYDKSFYESIISLDKELFDCMENQDKGYKIDRGKFPRLTQEYVKDILDTGHLNLVYAIDTEQGSVVGMCLFEFRFEFHKQCYDLYIHELVVTKDYRGKGVASNIVDSLTETQKKYNPLGNLQLWSYKYNNANIFYEKLGFKDTIGSWLYLEKE